MLTMSGESSSFWPTLSIFICVKDICLVLISTKKKEIGVKEILLGDKLLIEAVV